jgi:integrase
LFFRWAIGVGKLKANPIEHLPKRGKEVARDRTLARVEKDGAINGREIALLWRACEVEAYPLGDIIKLLLLTCCRENEIAGLRWDQVHGDELWLDTDDTKNKNFHIVPLSAPAKAILANVPRIKDCPFVFSVTGSGAFTSWSCGKHRLSKLMRKFAIEADDSGALPEWRVHDLRRTSATILEGLGVPIMHTEALLNHKGTKKGVARVYQRHEYASEKRQAAELLGAEIERIVRGPAKVLQMPVAA